MPIFSLTMPDELSIHSDAHFDINIWRNFKHESQNIASAVARSQHCAKLAKEFDIVPVTEDNLHILPQVDILLEKEFPRHGGAAHFLLSTLPFRGIYEPTLRDQVFHNCVQYVAFLEKGSGHCVATCGLYLMSKDYFDVVWGGWLVLAQEYRNRGFGRGIIEYCIAFYRGYAERNGQTKLHILTTDEPHVEAARSLYAMHGAQEIYSEPHPYVNGRSIVILEWDLFTDQGELQKSA
jgi:GNAT superfamily N-acetyltransferase